jgi:hypothetical protein
MRIYGRLNPAHQTINPEAEPNPNFRYFRPFDCPDLRQKPIVINFIDAV